MKRYSVFSCSCTSFIQYEHGWLFILALLFQDAAPTNNPATFGTFRGLILRSQLIILLKQKVSICRNVIVICLFSDPRCRLIVPMEQRKIGKLSNVLR